MTDTIKPDYDKEFLNRKTSEGTYFNVPLVSGVTVSQKADSYDEAAYKVNQRAIEKGWDTNHTPLAFPDNSAYYRIPSKVEGKDYPTFMVPKSGDRDQEIKKYKLYMESIGAAEPRKIGTGIPKNIMDVISSRGVVPISEDTMQVSPGTASGVIEGVGGTAAYLGGGALSGAGVGAVAPPLAPVAFGAGGAAAQTAFQEFIMPKVNNALGLPDDDRSATDKFKTNLVFSIPDMMIPTSGNLLRGSIRAGIGNKVGNATLVANSGKLSKYGVVPYASVARGENSGIFKTIEDFMFNTFTGRGPVVKRSNENLKNFTDWFEKNLTKRSELLDVEETGDKLMSSMFGTREFGSKVRRGGNFDTLVHKQIRERQGILDSLPVSTTTSIDETKGVLAGVYDMRSLFGDFKDPNLDALVSRYNYAYSTGNPMNIHDMVQLKSHVADYLGDVRGMGIITTKQEQKLNALSDALDTDSIRGMAQYDSATGTNLAADFVGVKKRMSERQLVYDKHLSRMYGKTPSKAYGETYAALKAGDAEKIKGITKFADNEAREDLASKALQSMGYKNGTFNIKKFSNQWGALADKSKAKQAMFGYDEEVIRQLDGFTEDMNNILESTRFSDKGGGILSRSIAPVSVLASAGVGSAAGYSRDNAAGGALFGAVVGLVAPHYAAKILSSPQYVGAIRGSFGPGKVSKISSTILRLSEVAKRSEDLDLQAAHLEYISIIDAAMSGPKGEFSEDQMVSSHGGN